VSWTSYWMPLWRRRTATCEAENSRLCSALPENAPERSRPQVPHRRWKQTLNRICFHGRNTRKQNKLHLLQGIRINLISNLPRYFQWQGLTRTALVASSQAGQVGSHPERLRSLKKSRATGSSGDAGRSSAR
jgi:hypothetical protein